MKSDDALDRLHTLLDEAGVNRDAPTAEDVARTWAVMRRFAAEPVEDCEPRDQDGDGILAQYGVFGWGDGPHFELDMTRQFSFADEDGEYDHMSQLQCTFRFAVTDELRAVGEENLWSFDLELDDFFDQALALPGFGIKDAPMALDTGYSEI